MPLIPEEMIDEIQARADIVETIGRYVPLKRAGRHYKANCPFHKERTPSFMVNMDKQIFHCFGCGMGGNIFSFLMQHDRLTFPEAVRQVADQVGVRFPEREKEPSDGSRERLLALMEKVCGYFERTLLAPRMGKGARAYLESRGVSERARGVFRLGLAPEGWRRLLTTAKSTGVSVAELEAAGLVVTGPSNTYDRFRHRLMFPITDLRGRVLGFGGRSLDDQEPKYLNSPESALYTKGRHVFGLAQAKEAILKEKTAIIVEGYFDCIVLSDAGFSHVVSPLGTALTLEQARLIKRYAENIILAFDADAAGEQATLRGIDVLVELGIQVRVAQFPPGVDPDEYLRARGHEALRQVLAQSLNVFDVLIATALRRHPIEEVEGKVRAAQFILPTIAKVPNAILRTEYVRLLADRLHLDESAILQELWKVHPRTNDSGVEVKPRGEAKTGSASQGPEQLLTALVLDEPARWKRAQDRVSLHEVVDPNLRRILLVLSECAAASRAVSPAQVISRLSDEGHGSLVTELVELAQSIASKEAAFEDCLRRLRANARIRELAALRERIRAAQDAGREAEVQQLLSEYQQRLQSAKGG